jgi:uncharacterized protein YaeQ
MALTSAQHTFDVTISDVDRGVYETLTLKVARHPSESATYLVARVLAYVLEFEEGIAFTGGIASGDDPAVWVRDLTGALRAWIEVGTPTFERLHKATKAADRVVVYGHKDTAAWLRENDGARVYAPDRLTIVPLDRRFVDALAEKVDRRTVWSVSVSGGELYVDVGGTSLSTVLERRPWG